MATRFQRLSSCGLVSRCLGVDADNVEISESGAGSTETDGRVRDARVRINCLSCEIL
jgi:hypothetical protein